MSAKKDIRQLVRKLRRQGWRAAHSRNGHWRLTNPEGKSMTCSVSPRTDRALRAVKLDAKRLGGEV